MIKERFWRGDGFLIDRDKYKNELRQIRAGMALKGLSLGELAASYGINITSLSDVLGGRRTSKRIYRLLEKDFNVTIIGK